MKTVTNEQALNVLSKMEKSLQTQLDIAKSKASPEQRERLFSDETIDEQALTNKIAKNNLNKGKNLCN